MKRNDVPWPWRRALLLLALLLAWPVLPGPAWAEGDGTDALIHRLEFRQAKIVDVIRALADMSGANIVATEAAAKKDVTVFLQNIKVRDALETISKNAGLWYRQEKNSPIFRIMTTEEYQQDIVVYREDITRVFTLLHPNPVLVASAIGDLFGDRVLLSLGMQTDEFGNDANAATGDGTTGSTGRSALGTQARSGQASLRRQSRGDRPGSRTGGGVSRESELVVNEKLTPDQLARIEDAVQAGDAVPSEVLRGISRTEAPIYITVNREHNLILLRTSDTTAAKEIEKLIREMDRPTPQVLLEMKILEVTHGDAYSQIFNLGITSGDGKQFLGLGNTPLPAEVGSLIYSYIDDRIQARLEVLQKNNSVNTLSSPILLASNNRPARVFVGEERVLVTGVTATDPVLAPSGAVLTPAKITYETEIRDIGNTLNIVPKINADRTVTLSIRQDSSSVLVGAITLPPITVGNSVQSFNIDSVKTANIQGVVVAKHGLTVAIGGLISNSNSYAERKVPLLGDVPILGELFKRKEQSATKSELILLIKPYVITNPSEAELATRAQIGSRAVE